MPMLKKDSGIDAAIARLNPDLPLVLPLGSIEKEVRDPIPDVRGTVSKNGGILTTSLADLKPGNHKPRDFDAEARGKTRCVMFAAALQSPGLAGMKWKTPEEFLDLVEKAAIHGVKFSFQD